VKVLSALFCRVQHFEEALPEAGNDAGAGEQNRQFGNLAIE
jgi:hypothetical protein